MLAQGAYEVTIGRRVASDEWLTPPWLLDLLGPFDLDPCASIGRPWDAASRNMTRENDGLLLPWSGRVWMNPPFGKAVPQWIEKLSKHGDGIALIPLRSTDAGWFHASVWTGASAILFGRGRLSFFRITGEESGSCPHASLLVAYGESNADSLWRAHKTNGAHKFISGGKFLRNGRPI